MQDHRNRGAPQGALPPAASSIASSGVLLELIAAPSPQGAEIAQLAFGLKAGSRAVLEVAVGCVFPPAGAPAVGDDEHESSSYVNTGRWRHRSSSLRPSRSLPNATPRVASTNTPHEAHGTTRHAPSRLLMPTSLTDATLASPQHA